MIQLAIRIAIIAGAAAFLVVSIGYLAHFWTEKIEPGTEPLPEVTVAEEETLELALEEEALVERFPGTIRARRETTVSPRIMATVTTVNVRSGDWVEEGEVLAMLDDRDLRARVEQARRGVEAAQARFDDLETETDRARELFDARAIARADLDRLEASLRAAEADLEASRQRLDEAETALSFASIEAPITGRVIDRYAEPGDTASPGVSIVRLYDPETLRLEADVRESLATTLSSGMPLRVQIEAAGRAFEAAVEEIVPHADAGARTFVVKVTLPATEDLYPGMFGRLMIPAGMAQRLYVPPDAVTRVGQLEFVMALEAGRPVRRFIRTGEMREEDGWLEVLSGLSPGERIVTPAPALQET